MTREMRKQSENNFQPDSDRQRKTNVNMAEGKYLVEILSVFSILTNVPAVAPDNLSRSVLSGRVFCLPSPLYADFSKIIESKFL